MQGAVTSEAYNNLTTLQARALARQALNERQLWDRISEPVADWDRGPLKWMSAHTFTEDSHALAKGTPWKARFPKHDYIQFFMSLLLKEPALLVTKSREVMASWTVMAYLAWSCITKPTFAICQSANEVKSCELIEYARCLYRNSDKFIKRRNRLITDNSLELVWERGGRLLAVPSGENQVRMFHPMVVFFDEAAFIPEWQASHDAVRPVAKQVISISTDEMGAFHNLCKLEEETGRPEILNSSENVGGSVWTDERPVSSGLASSRVTEL